MSGKVHYLKPAARRYDVLKIEDDSLCKFGVHRGEDFVISVDEFYPGDYHAVETVSGVRVLRLYERPPNLMGRVLPPHFKEPHALEPLPPEGLRFNTDAYGNVVEIDEALIERCWGVPGRSVLGYGFLQQVAPELRASFGILWANAVLAGGVLNVRTITIRKDGSRLPVVVTAVPARNGISERFNGWSGVSQPGEMFKVA